MADTKISALTGATTPLAGTEVVPVVQGGETRKVSISNLTAGRAVSAASLSLTSAPLPTASGGTGLTSFTSGGLAYASSSSALATGSVLTTDGTNLGIGTSGTFYGRVQSNATSLTTPSFLAQQVSTNGSLLFADLYYQNMNLITLGVEFSSGNFMLGAQVKPNTTGAGFYSTQSLFSSYGAAIVLDGNASPFKVYGADTATTVAVNSSKPLSLRTQVTQAGHLAPGADNVYSCGTSSLRWSVIYAATGTINTSDAREKTPVDAMTANEVNAAKQLAKEIGTFKFLNAVAKKGDGARKHIGMTVQRAIEIMTSNGLDPMEYGFICYDQWDDQYDHYPAKPAQDEKLDSDGNIIEPALPAQEARSVKTIDAGDHYGFRFEELLLFVARGFEERLAALEAQ